MIDWLAAYVVGVILTSWCLTIIIGAEVRHVRDSRALMLILLWPAFWAAMVLDLIRRLLNVAAEDLGFD